MLYRYGIINIVAGDIFVVCGDNKLIFTCFVYVDDAGGNPNTYCGATGRIKEGVEEFEKFSKLKKLVDVKIEPDYEFVNNVFQKISALSAAGEQLQCIELHGTDFQKKVWEALCAIPAGTTTTYKKIAECIGMGSAVRAVANAIGANNVAPLIPCHRVVRSDGGLGGYRWGVGVKKALLQQERNYVD